jgi:hypothetical protein
MERRLPLAFLAIAALFLREIPLLGARGPWGFPVDYDEGVHFAAAAQWVSGQLPYRDFVFVHPPGLLVLLAPFAALGKALGLDGAFALAKHCAALLGALNTVLVARLASQLAPAPLRVTAGLAAAAIYALYPEAVVVERGLFLEPWLNALCLAGALACERAQPGRPAWSAGVLWGLSLSVKLWAALWLAAAVLAAPRAAWRVLLAAVVTWAVVTLPFALAAPHPFFTEVFAFHRWRPPDGLLSRVDRLAAIAGLGHAPLLGLMLVGGARRAFAPLATHALVLAATGLMLLAFLASPSYFRQYNAALAPGLSVLGGLALVHLAQRLGRPVLGWAMALVVLGPLLTRTLDESGPRAPELALLAKALREHVRPGDCVLTMEPAWALSAGLQPTLVDSYGAMLLAAVRDGGRAASAQEAFALEPSQAPFREASAHCAFLVTGPRGEWQLSAATRAWVADHFAPAGAPAKGGLVLLQRR